VKVFQGNCGRCHTLSAAGTNGQVGPNLDSVSLSASDIESIVRGGRGAMPAFDGQLSKAEISAVAAFVEASH
jgi:mono/diheme cytochrome c family protein